MGSFTLLLASALSAWTLFSREAPVAQALDNGVAKLPGLFWRLLRLGVFANVIRASSGIQQSVRDPFVVIVAVLTTSTPELSLERLPCTHTYRPILFRR